MIVCNDGSDESIACKPINWDKPIDGPVHQHEDGSWWWYTETWAEEFGAYPSKAAADEAVKRYAREHLR